ncbi:unnamed protein product [Pleuronectes platessa]|uniref:Uncharacterized protein n=1 Tax=Pleuronectes platessa TaxID=8262 RepID=A0A9N7W2F3_PLEPL|nr:unnamed protein product [Pleuronectes platessa]
MTERLREGVQTLLMLNIFPLQGAATEGPSAVSCNRTSLFVSAQGRKERRRRRVANAVAAAAAAAALLLLLLLLLTPGMREGELVSGEKEAEEVKTRPGDVAVLQRYAQVQKKMPQHILNEDLGFGSRVLEMARGCDISVRRIFSVWLLQRSVTRWDIVSEGSQAAVVIKARHTTAIEEKVSVSTCGE